MHYARYNPTIVEKRKVSGSSMRAPGAGHEARYQDARKVTLVGAAVNIALSVIKLLAGWLGSSHALIADAVHSL